jgi:predicted O-linked N-acetylglucosamine transferase (SPINDLY family)
MSQHAAKLAQIRSLISAQPEQARLMCQRLVQVAPRDPWVQGTMAGALARLGNSAQALYYARRAVELAPDEPDLLLVYAAALGHERQIDKALEVLDHAQRVAPDHPGCAYHRALALEGRHRYEEALVACGRALVLKPGDAGLESLRAGLLLNLGRVEEGVEVARAASAACSGDSMLAGAVALLLNYLPSADPREVFDAHKRYARSLSTVPGSARAFANTRDPERCVRVGLLSPDLREHSIAYFLEPWLEHYAHESFKILVYQTNRRADAVTGRLKAIVASKGGAWHVVDELADADLSNRILADRVDILIEFSGHTSGNRLPVLHERPAPVQVTYLGYPNSTGLSEVDYRIVDSITDPPGEADAFATEKLVRLDPCFLCYKPPPLVPDCGTKASNHTPRSVIEDRAITFGSFNTVQKLNGPLVKFWTRLLKAVPESRLVLKGGLIADAAVRERVVSRFVAAGLDSSRVECLPPSPCVADHLAQYGRMDIALDPFPYNGTTTTCEALAAGVPVITLKGAMHAGRVGASLLNCVGLGELVAATEEEYIAIAQRLACDPVRRAWLRRELRGIMLSSPLCDAPAFAQRFDAALRQMWRSWCEHS